MTRILLVDDEPHVLSALQRTLRAWPDLQCEAYTNPFDALNRVCECDFDLVISDYLMPEMSGIVLLQTLKDVAPNTVRLMLSASTDFDTAMSAINDAEVFRFINKPWQAEQLEESIRLAIARRVELLGQQEAELSPQEREARRLEADEPGLLTVRRAPDGSVIL